MDELVKMIDAKFEYVSHEVKNDLFKIFVRSVRQEAKCPYCGNPSNKVHSMYFRKFRDLPIQEKKVEVVIYNRKFFCGNAECAQKTFAETRNAHRKHLRKHLNV